MAQPSQKDFFSTTRTWANVAALVAIALLASSANDVRAQQSTTILNTDHMGFVSQYSLALGPDVDRDACAPTTTTNYMIYLQNKHPQSLGYQMAGETLDDWIEDADAWAHLMGTSATGTDSQKMVRQIGLSLNACIHDGACDSPPIDSQATISYTYITAYPKPTGPAGQFSFPVNGAINGSPPPDYQKIPFSGAFTAPLETHQTPVSTGLTHIDSCSGHQILVTGITNDRLYFIDPLDPYEEADPSSGLPQRAKKTIGTLTILTQPTPKVTLCGAYGHVVDLPAQSLILDYDQYHCQSPYMSHTCVDNAAKKYPHQCTPCPDPNTPHTGGCPTGQYCISAHSPVKYLIDTAFWINFNDPHPAAANVTQQVPTSPLTAAEIEERHKFASCTAELHQAHESDQTCRTRTATQKCNDVLSSTVQGVTATNDACGQPNVTQLGEQNHGSAIRRLTAANVDIEDIGRRKFKGDKGSEKYKKYKCSNKFGRAISKHTRCEHSVQRMERSGLDASRKRARCDLRLRKHFEKAVKRYGEACPYPADPSLVISTNREEMRPFEVHEMLEARNRL